MIEPKPLWILTGFLGGGKTTLLRSLIRSPALGHLAVVINEFGEEGLDHDLIEASSDDTVTIEGGCLCCMVRGNLLDTLLDLGTRAHVGELPQFDGVIVETSGLADPVPVVDVLMKAPTFRDFYQLNAIITVVDGVNAKRVLASEAVARTQVLAADYIVVTKRDLCGPSEFGQALAELGKLTPATPMHCIAAGAPEEIDALTALLSQREAKLAIAARGTLAGQEQHVPTHDLASVATYTVDLPTPLDPEALSACRSFLSALAGPNLLRAKGLLVLRPPGMPTVLQAVQDMVYPPATLPIPRHDLHSRLVIITRNVAAETIDNLIVECKLPRLNIESPGHRH